MTIPSQCNVVYDLAASGVPEWWYPFVGVIAAALAYGVYEAYRRLAPVAILKFGTPRLGLAGAWLGIALVSVFFPAKEILNYYHLKAEVAAGRARHLEGQVSEYRPFVSQTEQFSVCGSTFVVRPDGDSGGFDLVRTTGSEIREGANVKIDHVNGVITHLEICPVSRELSCRPYTSR